MGVDVLMWAEARHDVAAHVERRVTEELLAFAESLQPAAEGWSATSRFRRT
jgi:hypothetical protein